MDIKNVVDAIELDKIYIIRIVVAMLLGGLVGMERQLRGRVAGLRTNILVCIGAAAVTIVFDRMFIQYTIDSSSVIRMDPARIAAGIITGVGFLGAGAIIKSNDSIRGLTTAASIWAVAAIGIATGVGYYVIAATLTALILFSLYILHTLPLSRNVYFTMRMGWSGELNILDEVVSELEAGEIVVKSRIIKRSPQNGKCQAVLKLRLSQKHLDYELIEKWHSDSRFDEVALYSYNVSSNLEG